FEGPNGVELSARLTGTDDDNFFSAISECFGAWYLAGRRRLELVPPRGQGAKCLEYLIKCESGGINVEVKAPYRPLGGVFWVMTPTFSGRRYKAPTGNLRKTSATFLSSTRARNSVVSIELVGRTYEAENSPKLQ
ncbi:hypothetical protein, partial [Bradyrhizobium sp.]|uniref:hypothetical protein n=1 Tax=Bradyrhizobium sp. TaxID=376 RepID=UPI003C436D67